MTKNTETKNCHIERSEISSIEFKQNTSKDI